MFILQHVKDASLVKWSNTLDWALSAAIKHPAIDIESIDISNAEMKKIDSLEGRQLRRLAFTLLCLAKYWNTVNPQNGYWVNDKDNKVMLMANINTSLKRQGMLYWDLREKGMVRFPKKIDNTSTEVLFVTEGEPVLSVTDFRNLGYQYQLFHGEDYFVCANCGITERYTPTKAGRKPKYCNECATKVAIQQRVNRAMRHKEIPV